MKNLNLLMLLILTPVMAFGQFDSNSSFGLKAGASWNNLSNLSKILVNEDYYSNYQFKDKTYFSPTASLFYNYHKYKSYLGVEVGINYHQLCGSTTYDDINDLTYTVKLQYHYIGAEAYFKVYPWQGLYIGIGGFAGFNLSPDGLTYTSNQDDPQYFEVYREDAATTWACMKNKISGKADLGVGAVLGYEFPMGICVGMSYGYSLGDLIETKTNIYNWEENPNHAHRIALMVGWAFGTKRR